MSVELKDNMALLMLDQYAEDVEKEEVRDCHSVGRINECSAIIISVLSMSTRVCKKK